MHGLDILLLVAGHIILQLVMVLIVLTQLNAKVFKHRGITVMHPVPRTLRSSILLRTPEKKNVNKQMLTRSGGQLVCQGSLLSREVRPG